MRDELALEHDRLAHRIDGSDACGIVHCQVDGVAGAGMGRFRGPHGRNPRWRVAFWRGAAVGALLLPIFSWIPPVVRWPVVDRDPPKAPDRQDVSGTIAGPSDPGNHSSDRLVNEMSTPRGPRPVLHKPGAAVERPGVRQSVETQASQPAFRIQPVFCALCLWITGVIFLAHSLPAAGKAA